MKILLLLSFLATLLAGCGNSPADSINDPEDTANTALATDSFASSDLDDHPMESVAIQIDQAGIVAVGMSMAEVYEWFDSTQIQKSAENKTTNAQSQAYTILSADAAPLMSLSVTDTDTVTGIIIQNPAYQTEKGIGVGSTFAQLSREYHIASIVATKDKQVIATVEELQKKQMLNGQESTMAVRFELGVDISGLLIEKNSILPSSIPPEVKITRIFL